MFLTIIFQQRNQLLVDGGQLTLKPNERRHKTGILGRQLSLKNSADEDPDDPKKRTDDFSERMMLYNGVRPSLSRDKTGGVLGHSILQRSANEEAPAVNDEAKKTSKGLARSKKGTSYYNCEVVSGYRYGSINKSLDF